MNVSSWNRVLEKHLCRSFFFLLNNKYLMFKLTLEICPSDSVFTAMINISPFVSRSNMFLKFTIRIFFSSIHGHVFGFLFLFCFVCCCLKLFSFFNPTLPTQWRKYFYITVVSLLWWYVLKYVHRSHITHVGCVYKTLINRNKNWIKILKRLNNTPFRVRYTKIKQLIYCVLHTQLIIVIVCKRKIRLIFVFFIQNILLKSWGVCLCVCVCIWMSKWIPNESFTTKNLSLFLIATTTK